jgi:hypothetical protein
MKRLILIVTISMLFFMSNVSLAFNSGSTGVLGAFNPQANIEVDLGLYPDGKLNYTTVNIPAGVAVTFKKNAANSPVYILATGDVTIAGTITVNGIDGGGIYAGKGGPGGYDGGLGGTPGLEGGKGLGPGGGNPGSVSTNISYSSGAGGGGGSATNGSNGGGTATYGPGGTGGGTYGNTRMIPLIGGSGGGGGAGSSNSSFTNSGGGGGGGAGSLLIASSGTITLTGSITANGGKGGIDTSGSYYAGGGGGGSGGFVKLMANTIAGEGTISVSGGGGGIGSYAGGAGGSGMIRFEANTVTRVANTTPPYTYSYPGTVFVTNIPTLTITSVGGVNVPANPTGEYGSPDITLPSTTTNPVSVNISATNIPVGTQVTVTSTPEFGTATTATGLLNSSSTASVSITLSTSYQSILTATATFTVQTAMYWDNEKIEKVRVATTMGKGSDVTYITEKGREIKSGELMAKLMGR